MLPMEPVAASALIRALLWQFSRVFITPDSQHGTLLSDSTALRCGWRSRQRGAVAAYTVAVLKCSLQLATWSWGRGSKGRISSSSFCRGRNFTVQNGSEHFNAAAAGRPSCRGARSAADLCVRRLLHQRYCRCASNTAPIRSHSLFDGRNVARTQDDAMVASACLPARQQERRQQLPPTARLWRPLVARSSGKRQ
jgi:hypothetical protein